MHRLITVFIASIGSLFFHADNPLIAQDSLEHSLLWEIKGNGLKTSSYLFGTIHLIPKEDFFLPKGTVESFEKCDHIFFELDMEKMNDMSTILGMMNKILMSDGSSLSDLLSKEDYAIIEQHFQKVGLPLMMFERMKPMFLSVLVSPDFSMGGLQDGNTMSYELEFTEWAKKSKKNIEGLETVDFQISIFDSIPYPVQAKMLVESIRESANENTSMPSIYKAYKEQNLNQLNQTIEDEESGLKEYMDVILNNRNKNWIPILEKNMKEKACFFAVGAGHLAGPTGVIPLLRQNGYSVTPVK